MEAFVLYNVNGMNPTTAFYYGAYLASLYAERGMVALASDIAPDNAISDDDEVEDVGEEDTGDDGYGEEINIDLDDTDDTEDTEDESEDHE